MISYSDLSLQLCDYDLTKDNSGLEIVFVVSHPEIFLVHAPTQAFETLTGSPGH